MPKIKKAPCPLKTAVAYARYSSAGQRDVSIDQQLADIRAFADREGYTLIHEYADRAKSGYKNTSARAEFQAMMAAAASGSFDTVIAWKVDRFGRNRRDSAIYKGQLQDHGVRVIYAMEPIPTGAAGVLTEGMLESIAEWYSRNLSENVNRGLRDNAQKCIMNGSGVYGYRRGKDGRFELDPDQAAVVRRIFAKYQAGYSSAAIAADLNASGLKTSRGGRWSFSTVLRIVSNERYTGTYIWADVRIPGGMPAIISRPDWERAQAMREKTGRHIEQSPMDFLLTGKVFCGRCGKPMVGDSGKSHTGTVHYYYTCTGRKTKSGGRRTCDKKSVRKTDLEETVLNFIYDHCLTGPERERIADAVIAAQADYDKTSPRAALEKELKSTEKKISNINDAIESGIWNTSTALRLKSLEESAESLRRSILELDFSRSQLLDRDRILFFLSRMSKYDRNNPDRRRQLIATFINSVFVFDDHYKIVINAVEGTTTLKLSDISPGSDSIATGLPDNTQPNLPVVVYTVAV